MESQRSFLIIGLAIVSYLLWQQWHLDYGVQPVAEPIEQQTFDPTAEGVPSAADVPVTSSSTSGEVPVATDSVPLATNTAPQHSRTVEVKTDTLDVVIDLVGGDVIKANLSQFPLEQGSEETFSLLRPNDGLYIAQSGLVGKNGPDASAAGRPRYSATASSFELEGDTLRVPLSWQNADGLKVTKTFAFTRGRHDIEVTYAIENQTSSTAQFAQYAQLKQTMNQPEGSMFMPTYRGAAYSTEDERYEKYPFDDIEDEDLKETTVGGWVGMLEHYFVSAWIPPQQETNQLYSKATNQNAYIGYTGPSFAVNAGDTATVGSVLYLGPKDQEALKQLARGLDLTVDYGFLWFISQFLFSLLTLIQGFVTNWGVAIILITIIVKGLMYPLTKKQYESMAKLRNLAPKMQQLKERFGDDRQKMSQAMMELYKKEKVNPMGGCLPLLLQMPIFLALYWVLLESVELRHADFALWITDLSVKDPYYVLPILTGASMWLLQKLQPNTITDPMQQKIMQWMPVMMSAFFFIFPAGLVLYWLVSNVITLIQAKMIYASMEKRGIKTS